MFSQYWAKLYRADKLKKFAEDYDFASKTETYFEDCHFTSHFFATLDSFTFIKYAGYCNKYGGISGAAMATPYEFYKITHIIPAYMRRYNSALALIDRYGVDNARKPILNEALWNMNDFLNRLVLPLIHAKAVDSTIKKAIEEHLLGTPLFNDERILSEFAADPFAAAIRDKDAEKLCQLMRQRYKSQWKIRLVRRILQYLPYF